MAIYSGSEVSRTLAQSRPVFEFVAAGDGVRAHLLELSFQTGGGAIGFQFFQPVTPGLAAPGGATSLQIEDEEPDPYDWSPVTITTLWKQWPSEEWIATGSWNARRAIVASTANNTVVLWTFPRGLIITPGESWVLGTSGSSGTCTASVVVEV